MSSKARKHETDHVKNLHKLYKSQLSIIKELFPDWTDEDLLSCLKETEGDVELAVGRISDGTLSPPQVHV
jgi:hypothetical protein